MTLACYVLLLAWTSTISANQEYQAFLEDDLASSPLIRHLLERVDNLEKHNEKQQQEIQNLKTEMVQQKRDMMKMNSKLKAKDKIIQSLLHKLSQSDSYGQSTGEKSNYANLQKASEAADTGVQGVPNRIRRAENELTVAFSVGLSYHMTNVGDKQVIKFDLVLTNIGNAYNSHVGAFIAPVAGIYVFSTSILSHENRNSWAYIAVNNVPKTSLFMRDDSLVMSSHTLVFQLNKGDVVSVQGRAGSAYEGTPDLVPYTTFSGFLLQEIYSDAGSIVG